MAGVAPLPEQPSPMRRLVAGVGRTLIAVGVLILLFVAYELWGTSLAEARSQRALRHQFLRSSPVSQPARPATSSPGPTTTVDPATVAPPVPDGDAVARLKIPRIKLDKIGVEGVAP